MKVSISLPVVLIAFLHLQFCTAVPSQLPRAFSGIDYNLNESKEFQKYCVITHCNQALLEQWTCKLCSQMTELEEREYVYNNVTNIMALMGYHPELNSIVMVFRGTEDIKNWAEDFAFNQVQYSRCAGCQIHQGFYLSYLSICLKVNKYIQRIRSKYPDCQIYSLGASLGGSLATVAALEIQLIYGNVAELHVFGCPRTGNVNFAKFLQKKVPSIRRVVHNRDLIPHLPLISQDYYHAPYEILFDEKMEKFQICNDTGEDPDCSNAYYPEFNILDHITYWVTPDIKKICQDTEDHESMI